MKIISIILISAGTFLLCYNLLHFSSGFHKASGLTLRGGAYPVAISSYYFYEEGYILGAASGALLLTVGFLLNPSKKEN